MKKLSLLFVLTLTLFAVSTYAMGIKTDFDKDFNFGSLKTFSFKEQRRGPRDELKTNSLEAGRIQEALTSQLEKNNFQLKTDGEPDFLVAYYARSKDKTEIVAFDYGFPRRWRWGLGADIWTRNYTQGSVMMDVIDAKTNQLVWRGVVTDVLGKSPDQTEKQINKASAELVKHFLKDERKAV